MKLKRKLVIGNMFMVVLALSILSISQLFIANYYAQEILTKTSNHISSKFITYAHARAEQTMSYLTEALINPLYFYDLEGVQDLLEPTLKDSSTLQIKVFDKRGLIFHSGGDHAMSEYGKALNMPAIEAAILKDKTPLVRIENETMTMAQPLLLNDELLGGLVMQYSLEKSHRDIEQNQSIVEEINQFSQQSSTTLIIIVAVIMCLISLIFSILLANALIVPITKLVGHSRRISNGEYQVSNQINRDDELGELARAFDEMDLNLKERTDAIEFLAYSDPLTKLPNRIQFIQFLEQQLQTKNVRPFAVFFIDLDEFKRINDIFGHHVGDELLCEVAKLLQENIRNCDFLASSGRQSHSLLSRVGGDEFLLCIPDIHNADLASKIAKRLLTVISQPIYLNGPKEFFVIGGSIGVALSNIAGHTPEELVKNADIAMYAAKYRGKGTYCHFSNEMKQRVKSHGAIERELRKAIVDFSQFQLWYQPKIDLKTGKTIGAEALIRWIHPEKGFVPPSDFIPIAEAMGTIIPIGTWVIEQVCRDLESWQDLLKDQPEFHVALNLSVKQLFRQNVADVLEQQMRQHSIPSSRVQVEVTETALMQDKHSAKKSLDALRKIGIEVWLDDFGTGYSSLRYLREFNIDGLKIDRTFVSDIEQDANARALCAAIISMAHQLGVRVVAEGVEETTQLDFLIKEGCDYGQGYLFGKPVPLIEFEKTLHNSKPEALTLSNNESSPLEIIK
ncbi:EAL domain-containing protein [Vibrio sinensis]|uniref:cyclic-guanylate-specific phosphodiesterase n=1 Tax=Vibrio sinensis TaxID=2302434 RepID=A0A3A6Q6X2_9VIBR|nr:EAL domain-containing protein [Vibrio sinensis]RJX66538.1 EAL domain-containing protein [Vibrio sinensis]